MVSDANRYLYKEVLSLIRGEDYAHAGETEAIEYTLSAFPKDPSRLILDAGCGLGGTAHYVQSHDWGTVQGFDLNEETITAAKSKYPALSFKTLDACKASQGFSTPFDLIYMFNVLYVIEDQKAVLTEFRKLIKPSGKLIIFDYIDLGAYNQNRPQAPYDTYPYPLKLKTIHTLFNEAHWVIDKIDRIDALYKKWYRALLNKIEQAKDTLLSNYDADIYRFFFNQYDCLLHNLEEGHLGGAVITASPGPAP